MKGFKDSTKTVYTQGGPKGGLKGAAATGRAMKCYKEGGAVTGAAMTDAERRALKASEKRPKWGIGYLPGPPFKNDAERADHALLSEVHSRPLGGKTKTNLPSKPGLLEDGKVSAKEIKGYLNNDPMLKAHGGAVRGPKPQAVHRIGGKPVR